MKIIMSLMVILVITTTTAYSQNYESTGLSYISIKLDTVFGFETHDNSINTSFNKIPFSSSDLGGMGGDEFSNFHIDTEALKERALSNFTFIENTYMDYTDNLRGCGPLEDGITKIVNGRDSVLSSIIDNFVNNYLLEDLFRKK